MSEHMLTEVPVFEAKVVVPEHTATSGGGFDERRIEG